MNIRFQLQYIITFLGIILLSICPYFKSRLFRNNNRTSSIFDRDCQIAITGDHSDGEGVAHTSLESGHRNVTIFEAGDKLGGNAKTHI